MRYALVTGGSRSEVARYLPDNYEVIVENFCTHLTSGKPAVVVAGEDAAGWTLDGYVIPRLASGLIWGREVRGKYMGIGYSEAACHMRVAGHECHVIEEDRFINGTEIPEEKRFGCFVLDPTEGMHSMTKSEAGWQLQVRDVTDELTTERKLEILADAALTPAAEAREMTEDEVRNVLEELTLPEPIHGDDLPRPDDEPDLPMPGDRW